MTSEALRVTTLDGEGEPVVVDPASTAAPGRQVLVLPIGPDGGSGSGRRREVVVDGWRFEIEVEPERRAALRERASRASGRSAHAGILAVRAVIPGRVLSVAVAAGDRVEAGGRLLVVEAMKMQNEVRAPSAGTIVRVAVGAGQTVELHDVLVELE